MFQKVAEKNKTINEILSILLEREKDYIDMAIKGDFEAYSRALVNGCVDDDSLNRALNIIKDETTYYEDQDPGGAYWRKYEFDHKLAGRVYFDAPDFWFIKCLLVLYSQNKIRLYFRDTISRSAFCNWQTESDVKKNGRIGDCNICSDFTIFYTLETQ